MEKTKTETYKEILPAIAQFAEINQEKVNIELIGYSRSTPNQEEIQKILDSNTSTSKTLIEKITYNQGEYTDGEFFTSIANSLQENERLVTYLAIPPEIFLDILKYAAPLNTKLIDLIIEKPFGSTEEDAREMLKLIDDCGLQGKVHFSDHYLFKTSTFVSKTEWSNFSEIKNKKISKITVQALELINVKSRGGYYNNVGALKDIFIHLFSFLDLFLETVKNSSDQVYSTFEVKKLVLGQYTGYLEDAGVSESNTDTYFNVQGSMEIDQKKINLELESGKNLQDKKTLLKVEFKDGSLLNWSIAPETLLEYISETGNLSINLSKNKKQDHTNLFEMILNENLSRFVKSDEVIASWEMYNKILEFKNQKSTKTKTYKNGKYPIEFTQ